MEDVKELMKTNNEKGKELVSFNPCFNGRCKRTWMSFVDSQNAGTSFNPCFNGRCKRTMTWLSTGLSRGCFNPCFNGRCKRTFPLTHFLIQSLFVSILVLMEDVKELCQVKKRGNMTNEVSILVLMEDVKELCEESFNITQNELFQSLF